MTMNSLRPAAVAALAAPVSRVNRLLLSLNLTARTPDGLN